MWEGQHTPGINGSNPVVIGLVGKDIGVISIRKKNRSGFCIRACKKIASFFVGVGKHHLIPSDDAYPPLMNSVIPRAGSYSSTTPKDAWMRYW